MGSKGRGRADHCEQKKGRVGGGVGGGAGLGWPGWAGLGLAHLLAPRLIVTGVVRAALRTLAVGQGSPTMRPLGDNGSGSPQAPATRRALRCLPTTRLRAMGWRRKGKLAKGTT